jgi:hypothetical protein
MVWAVAVARGAPPASPVSGEVLSWASALESAAWVGFFVVGVLVAEQQ